MQCVVFYFCGNKSLKIKGVRRKLIAIVIWWCSCDISTRMIELGKWAVIDIETTGIDESYDEIIDLGYLQFDGTQLVRKYSSLVKTEKPLSKFIQKLTGITPKMVGSAPSWKSVEPELFTLEGHALIAHNAAFEQKFLNPFFTSVKNHEAVNYIDTLSFFGLIFPERSRLGLEGLLIDFGVADQEMHRGYEDSLDLLKMVLVTLEYLELDEQKKFIVQKLIKGLDNAYWGWTKFLALEKNQWREIASEIEFDVESAVRNYFEKSSVSGVSEEKYLEKTSGFNAKNISHLLGEDSPIDKVFSEFKPRKSQELMALRVGQALGNGIHGVIQAPTGTGKTLAYMLPVSLFVKDKGQRALIATGTKTLQEQILEKDVPKLRQIIGDKYHELDIVRLVGSSNHLCELLFGEKSYDADQVSLVVDHFQGYSQALLQMIFFHNSREPSEKRILVDQIPYILKMIIPGLSALINEIKVDYRSCVGSKCTFASRCSYLQGLRDAQKADIIIGNHALMFHWPRGIDKPEHIIVDEAHRIEQEASEAYSLNLDQSQFDYVVSLLVSGQGVGALFYLLIEDKKEELVDKLKESFATLGQDLKVVQNDLDLIMESYFKKSSRYTELYWNELPMIEAQSTDELAVGVRRKLVIARDLLEDYYKLLKPYLESFEDKQNKSDVALTAIAKFENLMSSLEDSYMVLKNLLDSDSDMCRQIKFHADSGYQLSVTPIDIGKRIKNDLLDLATSVVYTSATLANKDGSRGTLGVDWMTGYSYLTPDRRFKTGLYLDAVFDYKNKTNVFLATDTPDLNHFDFIPTIIKKLKPTITELGGKTLMLFSSRKRFEQASELMLQAFDGLMNIYIQGLGSNIVESFQQDEHAVLIGMESFGEGIDIPGESLQLVYIDKVPDVRVSLLTNDRRTFFERQFGNEFVDYYLAQRTRSLHQKLGRLLRRETDWGAVIITDSRLKRWKGRTLTQFRELMEPYDIKMCSLDEACRDALSFIKQH